MNAPCKATAKTKPVPKQSNAAKATACQNGLDGVNAIGPVVGELSLGLDLVLKILTAMNLKRRTKGAILAFANLGVNGVVLTALVVVRFLDKDLAVKDESWW